MGKLALKEGMTGVVALAVRCTVTVTDVPCLCCQVAKDLDVELKSVREAAAAAKSAMHRTKADAEARLAELTATVKEQTEEATAAAETAASLSAQLETARTEAEAAKGKLATVQTSLDRQTAACEKCVSVVSRCMLVLTAILHSMALNACMCAHGDRNRRPGKPRRCSRHSSKWPRQKRRCRLRKPPHQQLRSSGRM